MLGTSLSGTAVALYTKVWMKGAIAFTENGTSYDYDIVQNEETLS